MANKELDQLVIKLADNIISNEESFSEVYFKYVSKNEQSFYEDLKGRCEEYVYNPDVYQLDRPYQDYTWIRINDIYFNLDEIWSDWEDFCKYFDKNDSTDDEETGEELDESKQLNETAEEYYISELFKILKNDDDIEDIYKECGGNDEIDFEWDLNKLCFKWVRNKEFEGKDEDTDAYVEAGHKYFNFDKILNDWRKYCDSKFAVEPNSEGDELNETYESDESEEEYYTSELFNALKSDDDIENIFNKFNGDKDYFYSDLNKRCLVYARDKSFLGIDRKTQSRLRVGYKDFNFDKILNDWRMYCEKKYTKNLTDGDGSELNESVLMERLLTSEFTFGFELEGILSANSALVEYAADEVEDEDADEEEDDVHSDGLKQAVRQEIKRYMDNRLNRNNWGEPLPNISGESTIHGDSSVQADNYNDFTFEYSSAIYSATPYNFQNVIKLLSEMDEDGFKTNNSCGFHHHIKFNGMNYKDLLWIYCNLAVDAEATYKLSKLNKHHFVDSDFASFDDIDELATHIFDGEWERAAELLDDSKYRAFRLHPQGTLEWRGPREFLNDPKFEEIKDFYKLLNYLITKIKDYQDSNILTGTRITKEELFKNLSKYMPKLEVQLSGKMTSASIDKFIKRLENNPRILLKISEDTNLQKFFRKMFEDSEDMNEKNYLSNVIFSNIKNAIREGKLKDSEIGKVVRFVYSAALKECAKQQLIHDILYNSLAQYVLSQRDADELLDTHDNIWAYLDTAHYLKLCGFEVKEPIEHIVKYYNMLGNTSTQSLVLTHIGETYNGEQVKSGGVQLNFMSGKQMAELALITLKSIIDNISSLSPYVYNNVKYYEKTLCKLVDNYLPYKIKEFTDLFRKYDEMNDANKNMRTAKRNYQQSAEDADMERRYYSSYT